MLEEINMPKKSVSNQPTSEQIAQLNALLHETEVLARQVNYSISMIAFSICIEIAEEIDLSKFIYTLFESNKEGLISSAFNFVLATMMLMADFYMRYKIYQAISSIMLSASPNGIGYDWTKHPAYEMQRKLGTSSEISAQIKSLKELNLLQKKSASKWFYFPILFLFLAALTLEIILKKPQKDYALKQMENNPAIKYLISLLRPRPSYYILGHIYNKYSNYNLPKQINLFAENLQAMSCLSPDKSHQWQNKNLSADSKASVLLSLDLQKKQNLEFINQFKKTGSISTENYLIELHRVLLEEKVPVYLASDNQIFVGFFDLTKNNIQRIQKKLTERLERIEQHEIYSNRILDKLNNLQNEIILDKNPWQFYFGFDIHGNPETYFYINKKNIRPEFFDDYIIALEKSMPAEAEIKLDENIVTISGIKNSPFSPIRLNIQLPENKMNAIPLEKERSSTPISTDFIPTKKSGKKIDHTKQNSQKTTQKKIEKKTASLILSTGIRETHKDKLEYYPEKINFPGNICFFRKAIENNTEEKPYNFAYPMNIPWLPEGRAYGSVDPRVFLAAATYLTKEEVLRPLENGEVHGASKSYHSKAGAVGIQNSRDPYQDVNGKIHERSHFKLKYANNIRIFGHNAGSVTLEDGKQYVHYRFDGPGFGH